MKKIRYLSYIQKVLLSCNTFFFLLALVVLIGGLELSLLETSETAPLLIALFPLLGLSYKIYFKLMKEKVKRLIKDKTKQGLDLSKLSRVQFFFSWFFFSIRTSLFLFTVGYCYREGLIPGVRYCCNFDEDFSWMILFIILIVGPQVLLICYFLNKPTIKEKFYLLCFIISLRIILIIIIILFVSGYNPIISEQLLLILSTGIFSAICESGILDKLLLLYPKSLINIPLNIYDIYIKCLIDYYQTSILKYRMRPFTSRLDLYNNYYSLRGSFTYSKMSLFKGKILDRSYYPSLFQSFTLPLVNTSSAELTLKKIMGSPILKGILYTDYVRFQFTGEIAISWCLVRDLMLISGKFKLPLILQTPVLDLIGQGKEGPGADWDSETLVGSDWDGQTVVETKSSLYELLFGSITEELVVGKVKSTDPQLNLSPEYLEECRVQTVYINTGKAIQESTDNNNSLGNNSEGLSAEVDVTDRRFIEFASERLSSIPFPNIHLNTYNPVIINELWNDYIQGEFFLPGRSLDFEISYNLEDQSFLDYLNREYPNLSIDSIYPYQIESHWFDYLVSLQTDENMEEWARRLGADIHKHIPSRDTEMGDNVYEVLDGAKSSSSNLSSMDSSLLDCLELEIELDSYLLQVEEESSNTTDNLDPNLAKYEEEFKSFMDTIKTNAIFNLELFNKFKQSQVAANETSSSDQDQYIFNLTSTDLDNDQMEIDLEESESLSSLSSRQDQEIPPQKKTSKVGRKITKKVHKSKYAEMSYLLSTKSNNIKLAIKNSKILVEKDVKLTKLTNKTKEIREFLSKNKNSKEGLETRRSIIDNLGEEILGYKGKQGSTLKNQNRSNKRDIFASISTIKSQINNSIRLSKLDEKDKTSKKKSVLRKIEKLRSYVDKNTDNLSNLKIEVNKTLKKLRLEYHYHKKWAHGLRKNFLTPEDNNIKLLSSLFQDIRVNLIHFLVSIRIKHRINRAPSLSNRDAISSKFRKELYEIKENIYSASSLEDALSSIVSELVKLNHRYFYSNNRLNNMFKLNRDIYTKFKEIINKNINNL